MSINCDEKLASRGLEVLCDGMSDAVSLRVSNGVGLRPARVASGLNGGDAGSKMAPAKWRDLQ
jgi:hypothetical protein